VKGKIGLSELKTRYMSHEAIEALVDGYGEEDLEEDG
jgi:hypothetical protein